MKIKAVLLFVLLALNSAYAGKVDKGFRMLAKANLEKAADIFHEVIKENYVSSASNYGLAKVYSNPDYEFFNLEQAYNHAALAKEEFDLKRRDNKEDLKEQQISFKDILDLKLQLEDLLLESYMDSNTVSAMDRYLESFQDAENKATAENIRNQLAFSLAKSEATIGAMQRFIDNYPESSQLESAYKALEELVYDSVDKVNTVEAFDYYLKHYPNSTKVELITEKRNEKVYKDLLEEKEKLTRMEKERHALLREKAERESKLKSQKNTILTIALAISGLMLVFIIYGYIQKRKTNFKIKGQKETIERKNTQILDSINYAKKIQEAILPDQKELNQHFTDSFILYKPRDIVSGDFYWYAETEDKVFIAAVDCTGHGVPGAFMSMIGNTLLNQTVHVEGKNTPAEILFNLRKEVISALKQTGADDEAKDGMDMALVAVNKNKKSLEFSGAFNPLYRVRNGELEKFKGDRQPIASYFGKDNNPFTNHVLNIEEGDCIYIFTDGYADQFGGTKEKKFSYRKLRELLISIADKPAAAQHQQLEEQINRWMKGHDQVDDMLVIGIKI